MLMFRAWLLVMMSVVMITLSPGIAAAAPQKWTEDDVKTLCEGRWKGQPVTIKSCMERNRRNIGHEKSPGDLQELEAIRSGADDTNDKH